MAVRPIDCVNVLNDINRHHKPTPVSEFESGFNQGLNQAMWIITHAPTLAPPNEWVSVEERLPEDKQIVLFHQKNGFIYCAEYFAGNKLLSPAWFIDNDCWEVGEVTHWLPLPAPPDRRPPEGEEDT